MIGIAPSDVARTWVEACDENRPRDAWQHTSTDGRLQLAGVFAMDTNRAGSRRDVLDLFELATRGPRHKWWPRFGVWLHDRYRDLGAATYTDSGSGLPDGWARVHVAAVDGPRTFPLLLEDTGAGWRVGSIAGRPSTEAVADLRRTRTEFLARRSTRNRRR